MDRFSDRLGVRPPPAEIKVRHDAPDELRGVVVDIAERCGLRPGHMRSLLCALFYKRPDPSNWSEYPNIANEVQMLMDECPWYEVYDAIEAIYTDLHRSGRAPAFESEVNRYFERAGIGWKLVSGRVELRGAEAFEVAIRDATAHMKAIGRTTSAQELHEAIVDLSKRPLPEITGAIQHAMAALECISRDVVGSNDTLGTLVQRNPGLFPRPMDAIVQQAWGWSSNYGRHLQEGKSPSFEEAEMLVGLSGVLCRYLARKLPSQS